VRAADESAPAVTPAVRPSDEPSDPERSDRYWERVTHFGLYGLTYGSLAEITRAAHLVVRGTVTDFRPGAIAPFGGDLPNAVAQPMPTTFAIVSVAEVLKGEAVKRPDGTIEVADLGWSSMTKADLPTDEVIIFLLNHARQREQFGNPSSRDPEDRFHYQRPNGYQCVLRNVDGEVGIVDGPKGWREAFGPFPSGLEGRPFESTAEQVRRIAQESTYETPAATDPEAPQLQVIGAVNSDPVNFGGVYLDGAGTLVIQYVGANLGRAAVEDKLTSGVSVRWDRVERSAADLMRILREIRARDFNGVFAIAIHTMNNQVEVTVSPSEIDHIAQLLESAYGNAVAVESGTPFIVQ
jgi:hypothetical protein